MKNVFISFSSDDYDLVNNEINETLKNNGIKTWICNERIAGGRNYATEIPDALKESDCLLLVLSPSSVDSINVGKELSMATTFINRRMGHIKEIVPVMIRKCDTDKYIYYLTDVQIIDGTKDLKTALREVVRTITGEDTFVEPSVKQSVSQEPLQNGFVSQPLDLSKLATQRTSNKYFNNENEYEKERLKIQAQLFKYFDQAAYDKYFNVEQKLDVLDVGANDGSVILDRIGLNSNINQIVALEYDQKTVDRCNEKYQKEFISFYQADVESPRIKQIIQEACDERGIQKFDAIHISMLLLHLRKPFNLIKTLKQFLKPGGFIFIKDIDDGYSFAYPDPNGYFQKAVDFYKVCENGGFRQSGRQIYSYLRKTAFKDIKLELAGMNTAGLDYDLKSALYEIYIKGCIYVDSVAMRDKYPDDPRFSDFVDWLDENLDEMEAQFFDEGFFFTLGTMIFVGRA